MEQAAAASKDIVSGISHLSGDILFLIGIFALLAIWAYRKGVQGLFAAVLAFPLAIALYAYFPYATDIAEFFKVGGNELFLRAATFAFFFILSFLTLRPHVTASDGTGIRRFTKVGILALLAVFFIGVSLVEVVHAGDLWDFSAIDSLFGEHSLFLGLIGLLAATFIARRLD